MFIEAPAPQTKLRMPVIVGLGFFVFGFLGFLIWSLVTPLDSAVVSDGIVKVGSEKKQVQHLEGGIVKTLAVQEGDYVAAGQVLLTLDETFAGSEFGVLSNQLQELRIREALLSAQRDEDSALDVKRLSLDAGGNEWLLSQVDSAEQLFQLSRSALMNQLSTLDSQIEQLRSRIQGYGREIAAKQEQLSYIEEELSAWDDLIKRQYANKLRFLELKRELSETKADIAKLESQQTDSIARIEEIQFERENIRQSFRETAANELAEVQLKIKDISKRIRSAENVLGRVDIRAPVSGRVVGLSIYTIGAVIKPGETIMEIVPEKDELVIGAKIRPLDIDKVLVNMPARIRIASYKQHEFPEFDGQVESVSADVFEDPSTREHYYTAKIRIHQGALTEAWLAKLNPGMPANVMIVTGESTPAQYLMEPLMNAFRTAWRDS